MIIEDRKYTYIRKNFTLHSLNKGKTVDILEKFQIYKHFKKTDRSLNDKNNFTYNCLYDTMAIIDKKC